MFESIKISDDSLFISILDCSFTMKDDLLFNIDHGYVEGICRGFKGGILKAAEYQNLVQCETLEGNNSIEIFQEKSEDSLQIYDFIYNQLIMEISWLMNKVH